MNTEQTEEMDGTLHRQWVRCGRQGCWCRTGPGHGPYWYHFQRVDGKLRKRYVPTDQVAAVRAGIKARQTREQRIRESVRLAQEAFHAIRLHDLETADALIHRMQRLRST